MNTLSLIKSNKIIIIGILTLTLFLLLGDVVNAQSLAEQAQKGVNEVGASGNTRSFGEVIVQVVNFLLYVVGILSVIMVIIGGIRYVVSAGDSNATTGARNTILYALIGLVIAFVAWGIVNFVSGIFAAPPPEEETTMIINLI